MKAPLIVLLATLVSEAVPAAAQVDVDRAIRNYQAVVQGRLRLDDLPPLEREEVAAVDRLVNARRRPRSSSSERCREQELRWSGGRPSELERRIIDLRCPRQ